MIGSGAGLVARSHGAHVDEASHAGLPRGGEHRLGAGDVDGRERLDALLDDDADQMDECVGARGQPVQGRSVGEASSYYLHILVGQEPRPRRIARQHPHTVSPCDQRGRNVAADKPRASRQCDQHELGAASAAGPSRGFSRA